MADVAVGDQPRRNVQWRFHPWQVDLKGRTLPRFAVNPNISFALFDDSIDGREAEPCALADRFCSKERLKDMSQSLRINSRSGINHRQHDVRAGPGARMKAHVCLI